MSINSKRNSFTELFLNQALNVIACNSGGHYEYNRIVWSNDARIDSSHYRLITIAVDKNNNHSIFLVSLGDDGYGIGAAFCINEHLGKSGNYPIAHLENFPKGKQSPISLSYQSGNYTTNFRIRLLCNGDFPNMLSPNDWDLYPYRDTLVRFKFRWDIDDVQDTVLTKQTSIPFKHTVTKALNIIRNRTKGLGFESIRYTEGKWGTWMMYSKGFRKFRMTLYQNKEGHTTSIVFAPGCPGYIVDAFKSEAFKTGSHVKTVRNYG